MYIKYSWDLVKCCISGVSFKRGSTVGRSRLPQCEMGLFTGSQNRLGMQTVYMYAAHLMMLKSILKRSATMSAASRLRHRLNALMLARHLGRKGEEREGRGGVERRGGEGEERRGGGGEKGRGRREGEREEMKIFSEQGTSCMYLPA